MAPATTVLVVDDEPQIRSLVMRVLSREGYTTFEAGDGAQALGILESRSAVDLVLTDIVMPGMDGIQLVGRVASHFPATGVIYMSGKCEIDAVRTDIEKHGFGFIRKPFRIETLSRTVREFPMSRLHRRKPDSLAQPKSVPQGKTA